MELLKEVLDDIRPDKKKILKEVDAFLGKLNSGLKRDKVNAKAITGGSIAKGTFLKGDHDCDIFVRFNRKKYADSDISLILGKVLKRVFKKADKLHGSRDYYQIKNSLKFEIIPVLEIKKFKEAKNITDCSPMHVQWVNKFPKIKEEIMLTKAFMKSAGVYGAESYMKGFSGHVVDILTIYCKGFMNLMKQCQRWKQGEVLDYYNYHKGRAMMNLNRSKTQSALIIVDPIDPYRNAAAVLSAERFEQFRKRAAEFLKKPSKSFFIVEGFDEDKTRKRAAELDGKLMLLDVQADSGKEDVVGARLLKALEHIIFKLKENDFIVKESGWSWDKRKKAVFWIITDKKDLAEKRIWEGPPVKITAHYENFRKMHKNVFEKNGRAYAEESREFIDAVEFVKKIMREEYMIDKAESMSLRGG